MLNLLISLSHLQINPNPRHPPPILSRSTTHNSLFTHFMHPNKQKKLRRLVYKVSVRSLFIFAMREETLRSIVRSPISTTRPPRISGFTCLACISKVIFGNGQVKGWVYLVGDLELLSLSDVLGFRDCGFEA